MAIVQNFTRLQWEEVGGFFNVEPIVTGVCLLFREEDMPDQDILPITVRISSETGMPLSEQDDTPLPDVPFRYYIRMDKSSTEWELIDEGEDQSAHEEIVVYPFNNK